MTLRVSAEEARYPAATQIAAERIREAAWNLEERLLWRGSDAARDALSGLEQRVSRRTVPIRRIFETKVAWPLTDAMRQRSTAVRTGIAGAAVAAALAAGASGAMIGAGDPSSSPAAPPAPLVAASAGAPALPVLEGAAPKFEVGDTKITVSDPVPPSAPPARIAWRFAQAFVLYEVGTLNDKVAGDFVATATPPLAKSLHDAPPRLPSGTKVPEARVLNVVLADQGKDQVTASVSLVRLQAISEVRLTIQRTDQGWRVAEVLG